MKLLDRASLAASATMKTLSRPRNTQAANGLNAPLSYSTFGASDWTFRSQAQNAYLASSAVFACVTCYALHYPQVRFQVTKGLEPGGDPWPEHPLQYILDHPNDDMDQSMLGIYNAVYLLLGGASHQYLLRNERGQIVMMRPYSSAEVRPVQKHEGQVTNTWVDHYVYTALSGATAPQIIPPQNVLSLPFFAINPLQPYLFVSPFAAAFLDVQGDEEMAKFPIDLMKNGAFITFLVSLPPETAGTPIREYQDAMPDSVFKGVKQKIIQEATGRSKGSPMVLRGGASGEMVMPDFRSANISEIGARYEVRICADARVPIMYAGFESGLRSSTYDNIKLSRIGFVKDAVLGLARLHARLMTAKFQRENWSGHPMGSASSDFTVDVDLSGVQALKDEEPDKQKAATMGRTAMTINEYRRYFPELGKLPPGIDGDQLMTAAAPNEIPTDVNKEKL